MPQPTGNTVPQHGHRVGEMQMAARDFAAGRYRHWAATLFWLPLALLGVICGPRKPVLPFRAGLGSTSFYEADLDFVQPPAAWRAEIATVRQGLDSLFRHQYAMPMSVDAKSLPLHSNGASMIFASA
jgi:hypothetical protein